MAAPAPLERATNGDGSGNLRRMLTRIITGLVLAPLVVWLLLAGQPWMVAALLVVAAALCVNELVAMVLPGQLVERVVGVALAVAVMILAWRYPGDLRLVAVLAVLVPALAVLARPRPIETAALRVAILWGSLVYIVVPFSFGLRIAVLPERMVIILLLAVVWAGDTGAYFVGRAIGRHKLYPLVSPKKTIEGAVGGLAASVGVAVLIAELWLPQLGAPHAVVIGLLGGTAAQLGDLAESLVKRACGVKDSGRLLPGHGGMLDRVDGVIFAFPVVAALL
ncbi:MAG: phosphatidate cytidylyltransferase [Deltaproteobacteria bacterium HGW-Deltaproteobacteria-14]|jgi:phosphatidate cytidylyltransferase|nr:MAG: phosphatidate cytidylyltransferase [Deltaproteobacteria bacterium HGW-Deltaproteobacteria-14]